MQVHPNETVVVASVLKLTPCQDGQGFDLDLEIGENQSPDPANDFLKPKPGDRLSVYAASRGDLYEGQKVLATLALLAGPFQERTILRKFSAAKP